MWLPDNAIVHLPPFQYLATPLFAPFRYFVYRYKYCSASFDLARSARAGSTWQDITAVGGRFRGAGGVTKEEERKRERGGVLAGMQMEMAFGKQIHLAANWRQISQVQSCHTSSSHSPSLSLSFNLSLSLFTSHVLSISFSPLCHFVFLWWASSAASGAAHHVRHHLVT